MTIAQQLIDVNTAKQNIKTSIENKGVDMTNVPFTDYHLSIDSISAGSSGPVSTWTRNSSWATVTPPLPTENKITGLAIITTSNLNEIGFFSGSGTGTVDWGDGTVEDIAVSSWNTHTYDYNDPDLTLPLTTEGHKQALFTVTFTSAPSQLNFHTSSAHGLTKTASAFGEIHVSSSSDSGMLFATTQMKDPHPFLEYINIVKTNTSTWLSAFRGLHGLQRVDINHATTGVITECSYMFYWCKQLCEVNTDWTWCHANGANATQMFGSCSNLFKIEGDCSAFKPNNATSLFIQSGFWSVTPNFDYSVCTTLANAFYGCIINHLTPINAPVATTLSGFSNGYGGIAYIESLSAPSASTVQNFMNSSHNSLVIDAMDISNTTDMSGMFKGVNSGALTGPKNLDNVVFNTSYTTCASAFYYSCISDADFIKGNGVGVTTNNAINMFYYANALCRVRGLTVVGSAQNFLAAVQGCQFIEDCDFSGVTNTTGMFNLNTTYNFLCSFKGTICPAISFSIANGMLEADALNEIFTNAPTVSGQTMTVTGNPGAATCDTSIATAKGWTVVT